MERCLICFLICFVPALEYQLLSLFTCSRVVLVLEEPDWGLIRDLPDIQHQEDIRGYKAVRDHPIFASLVGRKCVWKVDPSCEIPAIRVWSHPRTEERG
jgi:hypothetical protein